MRSPAGIMDAGKPNASGGSANASPLLCNARPCTTQHWDKDVCLNFADACLSFLRDSVDEGRRYSFKHVDPFDCVTLEQISE